MSVESVLRAERIELDEGRCRWPGCEYELTSWNPLELAHLAGKGMGGRPSANTIDNTVMLCKHHHRTYDGDMVGDRKFETRVLFEAYLGAVDGR
jgi:hypothetical protein